jgi:hypothetical protein
MNIKVIINFNSSHSDKTSIDKDIKAMEEATLVASIWILTFQYELYINYSMQS